MDLRQYLEAVRKYWWAILVPAVLAAALAAYSASSADTKYQSSVTFFITTRGEGSAQSAVQGDEFAQRRVNSYVALLTTERLATMVVDASGVELTPAQVRGMITASGDLDTVLLKATVRSTSEELALQVTGAIATEFVTLVDEVEGGGGAEQGSVTLQVVSGPSVRPVPTRPMLTVAIRGFLGLLMGLGIAVFLHLRDHTVRSQDDLGELSLEPVLASIPLDRAERSAPSPIDEKKQPATAEAFRHLRTNLQFLDVDHTVQVLVVSSSVPAEGKSFVSRNLALTMAAAGPRVLLIEADLRRPTISDDFDVERVPGLSDVLVDRAQLDEALRPWRSTSLTILPSGYLPPNPSELLGSDAARALIAEVRSRFDMIVIDTPPLLPVTDGAVLAAVADGVLLVVREGKTSRHQLEMSAQRLSLVSARFLGTVLNMVSGSTASGYSTYDARPGRGADTYSEEAGERLAELRPTVKPRPTSPAITPPTVKPRPTSPAIPPPPGARDSLPAAEAPRPGPRKPAPTRAPARSRPSPP